jgi:alkylation response protein AidB-like acyl-CoA dehydrogenase
MNSKTGPMSEEARAAFRAEVRQFIADNAPELTARAGVRSPENAEELALIQKWTGQLYEAGYVGGDWPVEFGGREDHLAQHDVIVGEEIARARAPRPIGAGFLAAHALIDFGTDEQRRRYLPKIRSGSEVWCQLFSEPSAGSDLASLRTKAVADGDDFIVNGQKVWTTDGQWASYGYLLARTDSNVPKHKGISAFALDMSLPGIDVRPLRELTGTSDFNEVFFDNVRVPAADLIGAPGQGWVIANSSLAHERSQVGASVVQLRLAVEALVDLARGLQFGGHPALETTLVRDKIGQFIAEIEALAALSAAQFARWVEGKQRAHDAPMVKLMFSELNLEMARFATELAGEAGVLVDGDPNVLAHGRWQDEWLYARAYTIAGGANELMRNLIAERGLGMPRSGS